MHRHYRSRGLIRIVQEVLEKLNEVPEEYYKNKWLEMGRL